MEQQLYDEEFEVVDSEVQDSQSSGQIKYEISTYPADYTLEVLCSKWKKGDIVIPDFQRKFVWDVYQASRLVESFMLGLPVPSIFLYIDKKTKNLVIDGQQRLKSVFLFYGEKGQNELDPKEQKMLGFKLKGLSESSPWHDLCYDDFSPEDKVKFDDCVLRATIVKQIDPDDNTSIFHIFERLNTGGTLLTNQEVRNCIYAGPFNQSLLRLNKYHSWRKIFTNPEENIRQSDVELILRFFALRDDIQSYKKPMKDFLSWFFGQENVRFMEESMIAEHEKVFKETVDAVVSALGERPFHVRNGLNSSVCDSVMIAFSNNLSNIPKDIRKRYKNLCENKDFYIWTSKSTNDVVSVKSRVEIAHKILFG